MKALAGLTLFFLMAHANAQECEPYSLELIWKAEKGDPKAQYDLGTSYFKGVGIGKDEEKGIRWLKKSSDQGYLYAQGNLGWLLYSGIGVKKDEKEGFVLLKKSAEQGYEFAQNLAGMCYLAGTGVKQNLKEAVKWFEKAKMQGNEHAEYALGCCYFFGKGIDQDYNKALNLVSSAAGQGNEAAKQMLPEIKAAIAAKKIFERTEEHKDTKRTEEELTDSQKRLYLPYPEIDEGYLVTIKEKNGAITTGKVIIKNRTHIGTECGSPTKILMIPWSSIESIREKQ